jgi:hypothetical protein
MGDCLIAERRHRHNLAAASSHLPDHPKLGHCNTWVVDKVQILVEQNHGVVLHPRWNNAGDFRDTAETFVTVALHSEELHTALDRRVATLDKSISENLPGDLRFLAQAMGVALPFLPVRGKTECILFSKILLHEMNTFDVFAMSLLWIPHVDGKEVFPKLPGQLQQHYKKWKRNRAVQDAFSRMRRENDKLESLNKQLVPKDLRQEVAESGVVGCLPVEARLNFPMAVPPAPSTMASLSALLPAQQSRGMYVGTVFIGEQSFDYRPMPKKRKIRTCVSCHSDSCPGKAQRALCRYYKG